MPSRAKKVPVQERSIATRKKLKNAARNLFSVHGYYKVTSIQIAKKANVPVGSFYNYFGNKKTILLELIEDFNDAFHEDTIQQMEAIIQDTVDKASALKNLEGILNHTISSPYLSDPFYKMFHALQFTEEDALHQAAKARIEENQFLEEFLTKINDFHPVPNIPLTARLFFITSENLNLYINHLGISAGPKLLVRETILMFERYIFGS